MNNTIKFRIPTTEEWDQMVNITSEDNAITHWENMVSWVHDEKLEKRRPSSRATRGYDSARYWDFNHASLQLADLGFRPAFDNLSSDGIRNGDIIPVGTLYMNGEPVKVPKNPVWNGDIEDYIPDATLSFGPALDDPDYVVTAIKVDNTFIADRVLIKYISYKEIETATKPEAKISTENKTPTLREMLSAIAKDKGVRIYWDNRRYCDTMRAVTAEDRFKGQLDERIIGIDVRDGLLAIYI